MGTDLHVQIASFRGLLRPDFDHARKILDRLWPGHLQRLHKLRAIIDTFSAKAFAIPSNAGDASEQYGHVNDPNSTSTSRSRQ